MARRKTCVACGRDFTARRRDALACSPACKQQAHRAQRKSATWLKGSRLKAADAIFVFSVGGGDATKNVSPNLVGALDYAKSVGSTIMGIVGRDGCYTAKMADVAVIVPTVNSAHVTPHSEAFQAVVWHLFVSHPKLKAAQTKWESTK